MKRLVVPVGTLLISLVLVFVASAQQTNIPPPNPNCTPLGQSHLIGQNYPAALEFPIWCYQQPPAIPATRISGANDWVDTFDNNGSAVLQFNDHDMGYRVIDALNGPQRDFAVGTFVHNDHWMIDLADISTNRLSGGVLVAPDRQFSFENGTFVVEADAAPGADGMGGANRFYEIDVTPARDISAFTVDALYGYGAFGGVGAVGCRLERNDQGGNFVCAMYDNSNRVTGGECPPDGRTCTNNGGRPGRVWETQGPGTAVTAASVIGGYPQFPIPGTNLRLSDVWRQCAANAPSDILCRDRFRMEITKTSIHLYVNGYAAMFIDGLFAVNPSTGADNRIPDFWFQQGVRPYFTSWINGGQHTPIRWHWDRVAVNPHDASGHMAAPSAAPSFCLGQPNNTCASAGGGAPPPQATSTPTATPTRTPVSTATPTPTRTPVSTATPTAVVPSPGTGAQTLTFDDLTNPNRPLNGQYPGGVVDWGTGQWFLSRPFGRFTTNSVSFNGSGPTSGSLRFLAPQRLVSIDAFNGGRVASTVTVTCAGQPDVSQVLAANQLLKVQTGWTRACSSVTIGSTNGWQTNFDNFAIDRGLQIIDFDNLSQVKQPLNGQFQRSNSNERELPIPGAADARADRCLQWRPDRQYGLAELRGPEYRQFLRSRRPPGGALNRLDRALQCRHDRQQQRLANQLRQPRVPMTLRPGTAAGGRH